MATRNRKVRLRRILALIFGLVGAGIMTLDSLDHIQRGFVGLSSILIILGALLSAGLGLLVGLAVGRLWDQRADRDS